MNPMQVAKLLLDLPTSCRGWEGRKRSMREIAKVCLSSKRGINDCFLWSETTEYLVNKGVNITRRWFEQAYREPDSEERQFFQEVFRLMVAPHPPKPLEEWM